MTTRRGFLGGLAGVLAAGFAPAAIGSQVLMPVRKIAQVTIGDPSRIFTSQMEQQIAAQMEMMREMVRYGVLIEASEPRPWTESSNPGDTIIYRRWSLDNAAPGRLTASDERLTLAEARARGLPRRLV
jgi:hypothetical protein